MYYWSQESCPNCHTNIRGRDLESPDIQCASCHHVIEVPAAPEPDEVAPAESEP